MIHTLANAVEFAQYAGDTTICHWPRSDFPNGVITRVTDPMSVPRLENPSAVN